MGIDWDDLENADTGSALKEQTKTQQQKQTKSKTLKRLPIIFFDAHAQLRGSGKTTLDFSAYITEAIREKLERDGAIGNM